MLRAIASAEHLEPQSYFKTLIGKNKDEPIGLLTSNLSTLITQRTQPTGWTVLNSLVNRFGILRSKLRKSGMVFGKDTPLPFDLVMELFGPLVKYGDHISIDSRGDEVICMYYKIIRESRTD